MKNEIGTGIADIAVLNEIYEIVKTLTKSQYQNVIYQHWNGRKNKFQYMITY